MSNRFIGGFNCFHGILSGDINDDQSDFLPFNDDDMVYDFEKRRYRATDVGIKNILGEELGLVYENWSPTKTDRFLEKQSRNVYRELLKSPYRPTNEDVVLFKIGRIEKGRNGIKEALYSQIDWVINFDKDINEDGISPNATDDLINSQLWNKSSYSYRLDPDQKDVGY